MHSRHFKTEWLSVPSASTACVPANRGALGRDVAQSLLILPLDAGVGHPGQNQSCAQAVVLLHMHTQVAYGGRQHKQQLCQEKLHGLKT